MMEIYWTHEAIQDREAIFDYVEKDNPVAALKLDALFEEKARSLLCYPHLGRPGRIANTRELVVHPNYVLVYDVRGNLVRTLRVLHAARQWPM